MIIKQKKFNVFFNIMCVNLQKLQNHELMKNTYLELFTTFAKIGAFTIGGGYAMIPLIEEEVANRKQWIEKDEMTDIIAIAQSTPGLLAVNISIFVGYKLKQTRGSIAAALGCILPSFLAILAIATLFQNYTEYPAIEAIFKGIRPVVVALIAIPVINMLQRYRLTYIKLAYGILAFLLIICADISPTYIIFGTIAISISYTIFTSKRKGQQ